MEDQLKSMAVSEPTTDSHKRNVQRAGGIMIVSQLLSRVLGVVRDAVMAGMFGRGLMTDAYLLAFSVPDTLFYLIAGGALSSAFIPVFTEYLKTEREDDAWKIFSAVTTIMTSIILVFIVLATVFTPQMLHLTAPKIDPKILPLTVQMSRILLPAQIAFFLGGLMFGTLYARQVFSVPALGPNVYNIGIILGAIVLSHFVSPSILGMVYGAVCGAFLGNLILPAYMMHKIGSRFSISFDTKHPGVRKVFRMMMPVVFGLSLPAVYVIIMRAFGTYYEAGIVTAIDYANKLVQAPVGIFGWSLAIAVFPALSQFHATDRMDLYRDQVVRSLRQVIYLSTPALVFIAVMAPTIVSGLYQQGKFTAHDTEVTALFVRLFSFGLIGWCMHPVLMRAFFAIHDSLTPILISTGTTAVFVVLILVLRTTPLGSSALPIAGSIAACGLVTALGFAISRKVGGLDFGSVFTTLGKSLVASILVAAISGILTFGQFAHFFTGSKIRVLLALLFGFLFCAWAYFWATIKLKMPESDTLARGLDKTRAKLGLR